MRSVTSRRRSAAYRHWVRLLGTLMFLSGLLPANAQGDAVGDLSVAFWGTRSGLPEAAVQALALEPSGGLWVGTAGGPCLFDGTLCRPLQNSQLSSFPVSNLTTLLRVRDGSLWAGTEGGGLLHITQAQVIVFNARRGLADGYVRAIYEDSRGQLWVGTEDGLYQQTAAGFNRMPASEPHGPQDIHAIAEDSKHRLITGGETLRRLNESGVLVPYSADSSTPRRVRSLINSTEGHLVIGTVSGAYQEDGEKFRKLPLPNADVQALYSAKDGTLWAGTVADGLWRIAAGASARVSLGSAESARSIESIVADQSDRLWIGTETGLIRIEPTQVHLIPSSAASVDRETLALDPGGNVLLVNNRVYRTQGDKLQQIPLTIPNTVPILNILYSKDGSVWAGTAGEGVFRVDAQGLVTHYSTTSKYKIASDFTRGLLESETGTVWVATGFGLSKISEHGVEQFTQGNGLPNRQVRALFRDHNGCIWVGTDGGPAVYCNGQFVENQATHDLAGEEIWAITEDAAGVIWLGTHSHGLYAVRGSALRHIGVAEGLLSNFIFGLAVDGNGLLWMSSPEIISSIPVSRGTEAIENPGPVLASYEPLPLGTEELRFSGGRFPNALVDAHNVVWFATNRGAVRVGSAAKPPPRDLDSPVPVIVSLLANDSYVSTGAVTSLPAQTSRLTVAVRSLYLGSSADVLLTYRLPGVVDSWTAVEADRLIKVQELHAGQYRLALRACSRTNSGLCADTFVDLKIPEIWYRSWWFYALAVASLILLWWIFQVIHLRSLRHEFQLVLDERTRLAREMHDTLIQGCNGVALLLEADASSGSRADGDFLDRARDQLRLTVADAREAVWQLRQTDTTPDRLRHALESIAGEAATAYGLPVKVEHSKKLPQLPASTVHEVLMLVREAVINAGSHARPQRVLITAEQKKDRLDLVISDDGVGFNVAAAQTAAGEHYGLLGMQERAQSIGADLKITSHPGEGTTVSFSLHLPMH